MDNRRTIILVLVLLPLMLFWNQITDAVLRRLGYDPTARQIVSDPAAAPTTQSTTLPSLAEVPATLPSVTAAIGFHAAPSTQPAAPITLGSSDEKDPTYKMAVTITPQGAGIEQVLLNEFKIEAGSKLPYVFQKPYAGSEAISRPLATPSITVNGASVNLATAAWTLESSDAQSAIYSLTIEDASGPQLRIRKTYQLTPSSDAGSGYEITVEHRFENLTDQPQNVSATITGPTTPPHESDRGNERFVLAGFARKNTIQVAHDGIESFGVKQPTKDYVKDADGNPLVWAGSSSIYFNALIHPQQAIQKVSASSLNPAGLASDHQIVLSVLTNEITLAPRQAGTLSTRAFFGPRLRKLMKDSYYTAFPRGYDQTLVLTSGPCSVCTFQWLIDVLVWLLNGFHYILFRDWGLAIIGLVVLVRTLLHPITKRSQISMSKMSKMGPEMERLKKKHGDNKEELNKAMVDFYKEQGATPILGCLPMFLQMPIWIALWQSLQTTFELRQAPFLHFFGIPFTWIHDLSKPDHLITLANPINIAFLPTISGLNLLPLLLAVVFWIQMKMQPKPVAMSPEQEQQQKMMQWMTLLFPVMLYGGPSGLNLYIMTSTGIGIIESKIIRDHIKQREEDEKAGRVIVDAGKKFRGGGGKGGDLLGSGAKPKKPPGGGLMGWINQMQEKADQLRRDADKKK